MRRSDWTTVLVAVGCGWSLAGLLTIASGRGWIGFALTIFGVLALLAYLLLTFRIGSNEGEGNNG